MIASALRPPDDLVGFRRLPTPAPSLVAYCVARP
jgi:hypothetical protein